MATIEQKYPNIAAWVQYGWIDIGYAHIPYLDCFISVLDEGGMVWEGEQNYESLDEALAAADAAIAEWYAINMPDLTIDTEEQPPTFTPKQGQYPVCHNR